MSDDYRRNRRALRGRGEIARHAGSDNVGSRGGTGITRTEAELLMKAWKADEWGWLRCRILLIALKYGEYHGDYLEEVKLTQRNMIGALTGALARERLLYQTTEHRASRAAASHGRRSYVYKLTEGGHRMAVQYKEELLDMALQVPQSQLATPTLFDPE